MIASGGAWWRRRSTRMPCRDMESAEDDGKQWKRKWWQNYAKANNILFPVNAHPVPNWCSLDYHYVPYTGCAQRFFNGKTNDSIRRWWKGEPKEKEIKTFRHVSIGRRRDRRTNTHTHTLKVVGDGSDKKETIDFIVGSGWVEMAAVSSKSFAFIKFIWYGNLRRWGMCCTFHAYCYLVILERRMTMMTTRVPCMEFKVDHIQFIRYTTWYMNNVLAFISAPGKS